MNINKKGFTLVELLAVIVILGIIMAIAIPAVSNVIKSMQLEASIKNEEEMIKAAKGYMLINSKYIPQNIGDTTEIKLADLQTGKFIGEIPSPSDKNVLCKGYVLTTKIGDNKYEYIPHLNCEANIGSSAEDKLIGHWTFDDFQEPTQNMYADYGDLNKTGVLDIVDANGTLSFGDNSGYKNEINYVERIVKANAAPSLHASYRMCIPSVNVGSYYTLSYKAKLLSGDISAIGFHLNGRNHTSAAKYKDNDGWYYFEGTAPTSTTTLCVGAGFFGTEAVDVLITEPQIEFKDYATPFVSGTRGGTVKDYSLNSNNATLQIDTTPKWVNDSAVGKGAYQFNGTSNYFDVGTNESLGLTDNFTASAWVKFDNVSNATRVGNIIGKHPQTSHFNFEGAVNGRIRLYWNSGEIDISGTKDLRGSWHKVTVVRNKTVNKITIYVDGEKEVEGLAGTNIDIHWPLRIGADYRVAPGIPFHGMIDDVKLYSRALTQEEIKNNYDIEKYKSR